MKKYFYILLSITVVIVAVIIIYFFGKSAVNRGTSGNGGASATDIAAQGLSSGQLAERAKPDTISLGTKTGIIVVKNFYKNYIESRESFIIIAAAKDYEIGYNLSSSAFGIALLQKPADARKIAEDAFLALLGIDRQSACKLDVSITAFGIDRNFGVQGLSFCQNVIQSK